MDITIANSGREECKAGFPDALKCHCIIKTLHMTALRNIGPQLYLLMKVLQEGKDSVHEASLLKMRLFHRLIQTWKFSFSHLPGGRCGLKTHLREVWMDPSFMRLIYHISPCGSSTEKPSHISQRESVL